MPSLSAYGHSWIAGEGASRPTRGLVEVAAHRLGCAPINFGVGGSGSGGTANQLSRQPAPASELYVVMTGLNDARLYGDAPEALASYAVALQTIFRALGRANPAGRVIAVVQPHLLDYSLHPPHDRGSNVNLDSYNAKLGEVAARSPQVVLATVTDWDAATMLDEDTVHPNDAGHVAMAAALVAVVWNG